MRAENPDGPHGSRSVVPGHRCIPEAQLIPELDGGRGWGGLQSGDSPGDSAQPAPSFPCSHGAPSGSGTRLFLCRLERPRALDPAAAFSSQREPPGLVLGCPGKINIQRLLSAPFRSFPSAAPKGSRSGGSGCGGAAKPQSGEGAPALGGSPSVQNLRMPQVPAARTPHSPGIAACGTLPLKTPWSSAGSDAH